MSESERGGGGARKIEGEMVRESSEIIRSRPFLLSVERKSD